VVGGLSLAASVLSLADLVDELVSRASIELGRPVAGRAVAKPTEGPSFTVTELSEPPVESR
jgi:hypothetical protein